MKILIVEDNTSFATFLKKRLDKLSFISHIDIISTFKDLKNKLDYDLFIVDFILKDAKGEQINYLFENEKKVIVITNYEKEFLESEFKSYVIDYVIKDEISIDYLVRFIKRFYKNHYINVLVVDDMAFIRNTLNLYLSKIGLNVYLAQNGKEALDILEKEKIDFVISDIEMPVIDGEKFVKEIRKKYSLNELPVVIISATNDKEKLIKLLKIGCNDYLFKPFLKEELIIRINNFLDVYDSFMSVKKKLEIDSLTNVKNRFFLENSLPEMFDLYSKKSIAMLDIDFFKKINDTYGHQYGDKILKDFADIIKKSIRKTDIVIRYGGEEFLVFFPNTLKKEALIALLKIKKKLKESDYKYTFSAGIADEGSNLEEIIELADKRLYKAKSSGRDKIVIE